jgi:hypothetical protein
MFVQPKKYGRYVLLVVVLIFVFKSPEQAAQLANRGADLLVEGADAVSRFASGLDL